MAANVVAATDDESVATTGKGVIAAPDTPDWSPGSVTVTVLAIVHVNVTCAEKPESSVAVIVTGYVPAVVGVPETTPVDRIDGQAGRERSAVTNAARRPGSESEVGTATGVMAAPEVEAWAPGFVIVTVFETVQVNATVAEKPAPSDAVTVTG